VPGSHVRPIKRRFKRNPKEGPDESLLIFEGGEEHEVKDEEWVAAPVPKGELILINLSLTII